MRVAYVHAAFWPYVRRGAERFTAELASYMTRRGHTVDVITTKPGPDRISWFDDVRVIYRRQRRHPVTLSWHGGLLFIYQFGLAILPVLLVGKYDIVHCWYYPYAPAAYLVTRRNGGGYIYHNMMPQPYYPHPVDRLLFQWAVRQAAAVADLSRLRANELSREHRVQATVLQPPVNLREFRPASHKDLDRPRILFASSLTDPQKGLALLMRSFNHICRYCPQAVLQLAGSVEWWHGSECDSLWNLLDPPELRQSIQLLGTGTLASLSKLYAEAAVTVLPSLREPFGMVLIESLASGTPVVGTTGGGPAEIITPEVGTLVELNSYEDMLSDAKARELADAILQSIELGKDPGTPQRCRERARRWDVEVIGAQAEALYQEVSGV